MSLRRDALPGGQRGGGAAQSDQLPLIPLTGPGLTRLAYEEILAQAPAGSYEAAVVFLSRELPPLWLRAYRSFTRRRTEVVSITRGDFEFLFDDYTSLEAQGLVPEDPREEGRVVAVYGCSVPGPRRRDDHRLRGWVGATERFFGKGWDKGHFIANSIGGAVIGSELNVFVQQRAMNRGWSAEGKRFRAMETYCASNAGTFCFARPIYGDGSAQPTHLEFGVLRRPRDLCFETFDNR